MVADLSGGGGNDTSIAIMLQEARPEEAVLRLLESLLGFPVTTVERLGGAPALAFVDELPDESVVEADGLVFRQLCTVNWSEAHSPVHSPLDTARGLAVGLGTACLLVRSEEDLLFVAADGGWHAAQVSETAS